MRLIDADALREQIERCYCDPCEAEKRDYNHVRCRACEAGDTLDWIDDCPTIDPESLIPHGRWKTKRGNYYATGGGNPIWGCSNCDFIYGASMSSPKWDFCPNCGAKMDKEG